MGIKSYDNGKNWETEIINYYYDKGYFVLKIPTLINGTVFDILAIRNSKCLAIECKHVTGKKLMYAGCGLKKKTDEIEHFIKTSNTNLYIYIKSDELDGVYWTTWVRSSQILKEKGYLDLEKDCLKANI